MTNYVCLCFGNDRYWRRPPCHNFLRYQRNINLKKKKKKTSTPIQKRSVAYSHLLGMPLETNWHLDILKK